MSSWRSRSLPSFILLPIILALVIPPTKSQDDTTCTFTADYCWSCSDTAGTYIPGDKYQTSLKSLLSSFSSNSVIDYGFYNSSTGDNPDRVNAIALCRGDLDLEACQVCLNRTIYTFCFKIAKIMKRRQSYGHCNAWFDIQPDHVVCGIKKENPKTLAPSPHSTANHEQFDMVLNPLLRNLSDRAASEDSRKKFAAGHSIVSNNETIYALAQCTPDLDNQNCSSCLEDALLNDLPVCSGGKSGGRVLKPSCN